jgi:hypothetical protein
MYNERSSSTARDNMTSLYYGRGHYFLLVGSRAVIHFAKLVFERILKLHDFMVGIILNDLIRFKHVVDGDGVCSSGGYC